MNVAKSPLQIGDLFVADQKSIIKHGAAVSQQL